MGIDAIDPDEGFSVLGSVLVSLVRMDSVLVGLLLLGSLLVSLSLQAECWSICPFLAVC